MESIFIFTTFAAEIIFLINNLKQLVMEKETAINKVCEKMTYAESMLQLALNLLNDSNFILSNNKLILSDDDFKERDLHPNIDFLITKLGDLSTEIDTTAKMSDYYVDHVPEC